MRRLSLLVLAASLACTTEVPPQNPYDPATPLPLQAKARVSGSVEAGAGAPFAGLDVLLKQNGQLIRSFTTTATGAFVFDALTPGPYAIETQAPGFALRTMDLNLAAGAAIDVGALVLTPLGGSDTGFLRGSAMLGRMAAAPGGPAEADPAADHGGILVEAVGTPFAAVTTSAGDYQLNMPPGTYSLRISHPNYVAATVDDQQVALGQAITVVQVILATNPAKVTGQVLAELPDGTTGPLADALVTLDGTSATGLTNAAGQFTLDQLAAGSYLLRVLKAGYASASVPVLNLVGGEERILATPLSLVLERGSLRGAVVLADTPGDASGVVVEVTGTGRAAVTGTDGAFAFDGLVAGTYEVRARRDGYGLQVVGGLAVTAGAVRDVPTVTLTRQGGTVAISEGTVTRLRPVTLLLGAPSAASYRASEDPTFSDPALGDTTGTHPYAGPGSSAPFTLSDRDGAHDVYVVFIDGAGGASAPASASIVLDRQAPVAPAVVIETGAAFTRSATVGLALSAQDLPATPGAAVSGLSKMELADNSAFLNPVLLDYNLAHTWSLGTGDGLKAVYARFHDRAGNVSAAAVALVTLDTVAPQAPSLALSGGASAPAGTTGSPLVTAALSATDANEGTGKQDLQVRLSNASGFAGATWQPYAASVSWLLPPGDGAKTVFAQFMDPAGNQSLPVQASITLAGTAPSAGSLTLAGGAAATRLQVVPVALSASGATEMRLFVNGLPATGWIPYATGATVDLGATPDEATRTVSVSFRNAAGVEGAAASASIVLDQRAPTAPSVAVNGGAAFTGSATVTLALGALDAPALAGGFAAGLDTVELAADAAFTGATVLPYAASAPWTFTGGDGVKTVWARYRDRAGNVSAPVSASVILDTTPPSAPAITLSGNPEAQAGATGTPAVTAALSATDANEGAGKQNLEVRLSSSAGFAGAAWVPYAATLPFTLPAGDGAKTVYAQFRDAAGNLSLAVSAGITLAATPPSAGAIVVEGGAAATRRTTVSVALSAAGAAEMRLYVDGVAATGWVPFAASTTVALGATPDEATRTVSVGFRGAGGLEGGSASTSILLDQRAPTAPAVSVDAGAAFTGALAVSLSLSAQEVPALPGGLTAGLDTVEVSNDAAFATSTVVPMVSTLTWSLAAGADGARTVYARFRDRAGNVSAPASATLVLDTTGPAAPSLALSGGAGAQAGYTASAVVTATLSATDVNEGAGKQNLEVRLGNDAGFAGSTWQPYATTLSWVVPAGDGAKQVFAQFRDRAGNLSLVASATITLVSTPPSAGALVLAGGAAATNQPTVSAVVSAAGAAEMRFFVNGVASGGWVPYATTASVALGAAPDEATRVVSVLFRTAGGVEGATAMASILLDQAAPTGAAVVVNGGAATTGGLAATLTLAASDGPVAGPVASGLATVEVSNDAGFATFTAFPYATSLPWTLAAGADGSRTVHVRFRDQAGNVSAPASDAIVVDTTGPTGPTIALAGNAGAQAGYTGTPVVTATLSATDLNEGAAKQFLEVRLSNDAGFAGATWQPYATTLSWALPGTDGVKTVYAQFRDAAGNLSLVANASITLAATPPSAGSLVLAGGAAATNQVTVTAAVAATGASQMRFLVDGAAATGWLPYAASASVPLGAAPDEATRTVAVAFRNPGGVEGGGASATILLDQRPPTTPTVVIDGGAGYAGTTGVTLALAASDGPAAGAVASGLATVEVANNAAFTGALSFPAADSLSWTLAAGADGARTVYARFHDRAGNVSAAGSGTIVLDTTGPTAPAIALTGSPEAQAGYTGSAVVTASLSATDANEGVGKANLQVRVSNDSGFAGATWQPYATSLPWVLPIGDGAKTVYAQFRDAAGNLSLVANAAITLDATPPTGGAIAVAGGAPSTNQATVAAAISASGAAQMQVYVNGVAQPGGWVAYATSASVDLGASPDETSRTVSVVFRNFGGVEGGAAVTSVVLDQAAPVSPSVRVAGGAAYTGTTAVTLTLSASDGPTTGTVASGLDTVEVSNDAGFAAATAFPYATTVPWTLTAGADGARTVYARFRDKAGNVSAAASDAIVLDVTGPTAPSIALAGNATAQAGYTGTPVVTATLSATDANEGAGKANLEVRVSNDVGFSGASWQPYTTSLPWVLPIGDGAKTVYAQFRDAVGNLSLPVNAGITLAETPPSAGTIALAGGAPATNQQTVTATLGASGATRMQLYVNGVAQPGGFVAYATSASVDLGLAPDESTRTVSVVFRNAGGVDGGDALTTIVMDRTAPTAPSVQVAAGAAYTGTSGVTLSVSAQDGPVAGTVASGVASVEVANNAAFTGSTTFAIADSVPWTLPAGDGSKTVYARFRDKAGNASATASDAIVLDTTGPTAPTIALTGNSEASAGYTGTPVVTATLSATDVNEGSGKANLQLRIANDVGFSGASWQPYATSLQWVLPTGDGTKTVYAQFRDAAGNVSSTASTTIQLLATPPSGGSLVLASGAAATAAQVIPVTISASNAATMRLSVNGVAVTGWIAYATSTTVDLGASPDQATRAVTVSFRNAGGVEGGAATATIRFDRTAPAAGSLAISGTLGNGGTSATLTATPAVVLRITPPGGDETDMAVTQAATALTACSASFATPLWQPVSRSATLVLTGSDGAKRACVVFRDAAGNFSAATAAAADITLDTTPPTNPEYVNVTSRTQNNTAVPMAGLPQVTASTDATSGGVTYQCVGGVSPRYGPQWVDCGAATTLPLAWTLAPNQESTLGVRARDAAYNYSPGSFVRLVHDDVAPFPPFITDVRASRDSVSVTWDATADADVVSYLVYYGNSATDLAGSGAAQGPSPVQLAAAPGQAAGSLTLTNLVPGLPYYVSIEAVDAAGNRSGPGGQRQAVPSKANPRVLSTFAGQPRTMASAVSGSKTYLYLAENQGIVQLDVSSDAGLPAVVGRAYLPDLVPDQGGTLAVMPCTKGATTGHCVFPTGTTAEGEYRSDKDNYRASTPVVFFKTTGTNLAPVVGTIEAILPVRPTHVVVGTFAGEKVVITVDRQSVRAFTFKAGQLAFLRQVARRDISASVLAVYAASLVGPELQAFMRVDPRDDSAPNLWTFDLTNVLAGTITETRHGPLLDDRGFAIGDIRSGLSVQRFVPAFHGGVFLSYVSALSDQTVISWYWPGFAGPQDTWTFASGAGSDGTEPVASAGAAVTSAGAVSQNVYVFTSGGMGSPQVFRILYDGGLTDEVSYTWGSGSTWMSDAVAAYAGFNHLNQERLWSIESAGENRTLERYTVSSAVLPAISHLTSSFKELPPDTFAESDRFLFVAAGKYIHTVDAANPYTPNVVQSYNASWMTGITKLFVHGSYLWVLGGNYLDVYRINGNGSLTRRTGIFDGITSAAVVGRWLFTVSSLGLRAWDITNVGAAAPSMSLVTTLAPGVTINAIDARFDNSTAGSPGVNPVPNAIIYAVTAAAELRTFGFNGTTLSALGTSAWSGEAGTSVRVKGDYAVTGTPSGAYLHFVGTPASPFLTGPAIYQLSGPPLLQNGYVVGLGAAGDASGPVFAGRNSAGVDGAIRFSACTAPQTGAAGSLTHVDGRYAASCNGSGITFFTPVSVEGGRLLKSQDIAATWNGYGAALASDGMIARLAGPQVGNDVSRLYTADERSLAEGTLSTPSYASTNLWTNVPSGAAGTDTNRSASFMVESDGVIYVVTRRSFAAPTVDAFEPSTTPWVYLGRYTFVGTAEPAAVATDGEYLYVARNGTAGQVDVVDIRNPASMTLRASSGALFANYRIASLTLSRDRLYAGMDQGIPELNEVRIWDTSAVQTSGTLTARTTLQLGTEGGITGVSVVGGTLFYTLWDPIYQVPQYQLGVARLGTTDRDGGAGASVLARVTLSTPAQSPIVAGDVLYVASNLGTASFDLAPFWRDGAAPAPVGGVNLADPFRSAPVTMRIDGPFASMVGGTYRVFDLR